MIRFISMNRIWNCDVMQARKRALLEKDMIWIRLLVLSV